MARRFTKFPSRYVKASTDDFSHLLIEDIKHALFDTNDMPQAAADGTEHRLQFVTWVGDSRSFIVTDGVDEYRVSVTKEL